MTTLTDTNDPDIWAMEFCRLWNIAPSDTSRVSLWFQSAFETAVKLHEKPEEAHAFPMTEALVNMGTEVMERVAEMVDPEPGEETHLDPMLVVLYATDDVQVWAKEFCETLEGKVVTTDESEGVDPGLMIGWFANIVETCKRIDQENRRDAMVPPSVTPTEESG